MTDRSETKSILLVPGTASLEPGIREVCNQLEDRVRTDGKIEQFEQNDWRKLVLVARLHTKALDRTSTGEKRIFSKSVRQRSGWWGNSADAKIVDANLERILVRAALDSAGLPEAAAEVKRHLRGPGVFALRHARLTGFAFVGRDANQLLGSLRRLLWLAFDGLGSVNIDGDCDENDAVAAAALLLTRQSDWRLTLVAADGSEAERQTLQNELTLRLRCLWPRGLNARLNQSLICLKELRELDWCRAMEGGNDRSHVLVEEDSTALEARRLGLTDLQFDDVRRIVFEADDSGLYRCDDTVREFSRLARQLRARASELRQADFDACHRLHAMAAELSAKSQIKQQLKFRRDVRHNSGWWHAEDNGLELFDDSVANLDQLAQTLTRKLEPVPSSTNYHGSSGAGGYPKLQTPGVFVLKHRSRQSWRFVSKPCENVLTNFRRLLHRSLDGFSDNGCSRCAPEDDPDRHPESFECVTAAMLLLSTADEWQFELHSQSDELLSAQLYNSLVLQNDSLWPGGANLALIIDWRTLPSLLKDVEQRPPVRDG